MRRFNNFNYATLVWLVSVFLTPILFFTLSFFQSGLGNTKILGGPLNIFFMMIAFGFLHSIPNWILLFFATRHFNKMDLNNTDKKIKLSFIGILLTCALFLIYNNLNFKIGFSWMVVFFYSSTIVLGIWIIPLKKSMIRIIQSEDVLDEPIY